MSSTLNEVLRNLEQEHCDELKDFAANIHDPLQYLLDQAEAAALSHSDPEMQNAVYELFRKQVYNVRRASFKSKGGPNTHAVDKASLVLVALVNQAAGSYKEFAARLYNRNACNYIKAMQRSAKTGFRDYIPMIERYLARANLFGRSVGRLFPIHFSVYATAILGHLSVACQQMREMQEMAGSSHWMIDPTEKSHPYQEIMKRLDTADSYWNRLPPVGKQDVDACIAATHNDNTTSYSSIKSGIVIDTAHQLLRRAKRRAERPGVSPQPVIDTLEQHCAKYLGTIPQEMKQAIEPSLQAHQKV